MRIFSTDSASIPAILTETAGRTIGSLRIMRTEGDSSIWLRRNKNDGIREIYDRGTGGGGEGACGRRGADWRGDGLSSFPEETGHMGLNERCDLISSFEKVIRDMNKLGRYDDADEDENVEPDDEN